ncbi:cell wall metabolism sensor histidine kinase WalK [Leucobacter sp. wl10]|uniref:sensor histidine kinase n=1 Tax=Leucobacter sp. wl10 TaxID=2304677 RepID=UPI000E5AED37|nr:ATP-binding protein [Leucobacter sp. wl10]RGE18886.1 HAMP domain-containing protein [Leucobacter sp. wl10]
MTRLSGLAARLLAATAVVVFVGWATAWVVVAAVGPAIFHDHMIRGQASEPGVVQHAGEAFQSASALSLAGALLAALVASVVVSLFLARRVNGSLVAATDAAHRVAAGDHSARVPRVGLGREFDDLAEAFNTMATDLAEVETTRTRMLGDLAHEMRTPLATLDGYLEAILDGVRGADEETITLLRDQVARLSRLGEDIALVTTAEEGGLTMHRREVTVTALLAAAHAEAQARYLERGVRLERAVSAAAAQARVDADPDRLAQVLTNLLDNALRHTPAGGRVELSAERQGPAVLLRVADDGEGITAEHLPRLFDRFYRADTARDRAHGGSGIGLAVVDAIVRAHGGTVNATSAGPGQGATFTVTLPADGFATAAG